MSETVTSFCRMCGACCGVRVTVEDGIALRLAGDRDHPVSRGYACPKGRRMIGLVDDPAVIDEPLSLVDPAKRTGRSMITANDTPALILQALADPCCYPAFGQRAALTFARHTGPFGILDSGHFPQWEAAIMNDAITMYCGDRLGR
ncbi:MAG TPA: hypothetical protein VGM12_29685 [Trebonia sp.]